MFGRDRILGVFPRAVLRGTAVTERVVAGAAGFRRVRPPYSVTYCDACRTQHAAGSGRFQRSRKKLQLLLIWRLSPRMLRDMRLETVGRNKRVVVVIYRIGKC